MLTQSILLCKLIVQKKYSFIRYDTYRLLRLMFWPRLTTIRSDTSTYIVIGINVTFNVFTGGQLHVFQ